MRKVIGLIGVLILLAGCASTASPGESSSQSSEVTMGSLELRFKDKEQYPADFISYASEFLGKPGFEELPALIKKAEGAVEDKAQQLSILEVVGLIETLDDCYVQLANAKALMLGHYWTSGYFENKANAEVLRWKTPCGESLLQDIESRDQNSWWARENLEKQLAVLSDWAPKLAEQYSLAQGETQAIQDEITAELQAEYEELAKGYKVTSDEFDTRVAYRSSTTTSSRSSTTMFLEVDYVHTGRPGLYLTYQYFGSDWIFIESVEALVDGELSYRDSADYFAVQRDVMGGGKVAEYWGSGVSDSDIEDLQRLASGETVKIKYSGDGDKELVWELTSKEKAALLDVLKLYGVLERLADSVRGW